MARSSPVFIRPRMRLVFTFSSSAACLIVRKRRFTGSSVTRHPYARTWAPLVVDGFPVDGLQRGEAGFHFGLLAEVFQRGELGLQG